MTCAENTMRKMRQGKAKAGEFDNLSQTGLRDVAAQEVTGGLFPRM
jgi:hypothetical protein